MTDKKPVIVYGASGYTGRLVCNICASCTRVPSPPAAIVRGHRQ